MTSDASPIFACSLATTPSLARKSVALVVLTLQNTALLLLTKFSFFRETSPYLPSTVIVCAELLKLVASFLLTVYSGSFGSLSRAIHDLCHSATRLALPSVLYYVQNSLLFEGVRLLSPMVYIVCSQTKILTSAAFSVLLLDVHLGWQQYASFVLLMCGMILVQQSEAALPDSERRTSDSSSQGLFITLTATVISGFTGAYIEKLYKGAGNGRQHSIWLRNTQLACFSLPVAFLGAFWRDGDTIRELGFFQGYDDVVLMIICLQALGGLVVAAVMRYASNILKCFAVSVSICMCTIATFLVDIDGTRDVRKVGVLIPGLILVIVSTFLYSSKRIRCKLAS